VVDDERLIADTLTAVLRQSGFAATAAYGGSSALDLAAITPPQLLITDINMPGMSGIQLALAIVHAIPTCNVLLFSGHGTHIDLIEARRAGYNFPLLAKPVHPSNMLRYVQESLKLQPQQQSFSLLGSLQLG
jgi:DNA-binding NtrC family response regulator